MKYIQMMAGVNFWPDHSVMVGCLLGLAGIVLISATPAQKKSKLRK